MQKYLFLLAVLALGACKFQGEIEPDIECTNTCEEEETKCHDECKTECVNADGDLDEVCDEDCKVVCDEDHETCTGKCTTAD